jgi:hypothetical protein
MTPTKIKQGQFITLSSTEQSFELDGAARDLQEVLLILGATTSVQLAVSNSVSPVIDPTYSTYTEEGLKLLLTVDPGISTLRAKGSGTINIIW